MSDTFRKAMLNKLPPMPPTRAPWASSSIGDDGDEQEELDGGDTISDLHDSLPNNKDLGSGSSLNKQDLSPISASQFFSQALEVQPTGNPTTLRVYLTPPNHSSGSSSSSRIPGRKENDNGSLLICHHGAGASGLSFAALAKEVREGSAGEMGVLSFDARGHGKTRTEGPKSAELDLSLSTLLSDFISLLEHIYPEPSTAPTLILMGHSMGAAPILAAIPILQKKGYKIPGVIILDVVEGTAVESLPLMKGILSKRPKNFKSVIDSIHWHLQSNSIRNPTSARVSVPSYLVPSPDNTDPGPQSTQIWRTDLLATEPYWREWWDGLSQKFLTARCARMLVLAGQERLDKDLMVGQMQGKFQLEVMQDVGHYLHEDNPSALASIIIAFWKRNTQVLILPPKIGATPGDRRGSVEVRQVGQE